MNIPKLHIGHLTADIPIVQCGMGVRVSLASLTAAGSGGTGRGSCKSTPWLVGTADEEISQYGGCADFVM